MKIKRVVKPGRPGTKKLVQQYGDNLICVRYRYDAENRRVLKTIELVIENEPWQPDKQKIPMNKIVNLRIAIGESTLQSRVKKVGGKWDRKKRAWRVAYRDALALELLDRIME